MAEVTMVDRRTETTGRREGRAFLSGRSTNTAASKEAKGTMMATKGGDGDRGTKGVFRLTNRGCNGNKNRSNERRKQLTLSTLSLVSLKDVFGKKEKILLLAGNSSLLRDFYFKSPNILFCFSILEKCPKYVFLVSVDFNSLPKNFV